MGSTSDFGLRDAALMHAFNLKKKLDRITANPANFIFLGDLNTMGINDPAPYSKSLDFSAKEEVNRLRKWSSRRNMVLMNKETTSINGIDKEVTWYNGSKYYTPSNLDQVVASKQMDIRGQGNNPSIISVLGWTKLPENQWKTWLDKYSDHAMLYFEVW